MLFYFNKIVTWLLLVPYSALHDYKDLGNSLVWGLQEVDPVERIQGQGTYQEVQESPTGESHREGNQPMRALPCQPPPVYGKLKGRGLCSNVRKGFKMVTAEHKVLCDYMVTLAAGLGCHVVDRAQSHKNSRI